MGHLLCLFVEILGGYNRLKFEDSVRDGHILVGKQNNVPIILIILGDILFHKLMNLLKLKKDSQFGVNHFCFLLQIATNVIPHLLTVEIDIY